MVKNAFRDTLKSRLSEICNDKGWNVDNAQQRGHAFEDFIAKLFFDYYSLDFDVDEVITRTNDGKADILIEPQGSLTSWIVIQCESGGLGRKSRPMKKDKVEAFFLQFSNLIDEEWLKNQKFTRSYKNKLIDFSKWANDLKPVRYIYAGNLDEPANSEQLIREVKKRVNSDVFSNVSFEIMDEAKLAKLFAELSSVGSAEPISLSFTVPENQTIYGSFGGRKMFLGLLKGNIVGEWQHSYSERLFDQNIRMLLASGRINKAMAETINGTPKDFLFYNNGITAICDKLDFDDISRQLSVTGFSIINGAQTVGTIHANRHASSMDSVYVMVRIIETGYGELGGEITRYNNTQNVVNAADFKSNDKVQKWLEKHIGDQNKTPVIPDLVYRRKRPFKRGKSGQVVLNINELAKIRCVDLKGSDVMNSDPGKFWISEEDGIYDELFSSKNGYFSPVEMNMVYLLFASKTELEEKLMQKKETNPEVYFALKRFVWLAVDAFNKFLKEFTDHYGDVDKLISDKACFDKALSAFWRAFEPQLDKVYNAEIIKGNTTPYTFIRSNRLVSSLINETIESQKLAMSIIESN